MGSGPGRGKRLTGFVRLGRHCVEVDKRSNVRVTIVIEKSRRRSRSNDVHPGDDAPGAFAQGRKEGMMGGGGRKVRHCVAEDIVRRKKPEVERRQIVYPSSTLLS